METRYRRVSGDINDPGGRPLPLGIALVDRGCGWGERWHTVRNTPQERFRSTARQPYVPHERAPQGILLSAQCRARENQFALGQKMNSRQP
jgi:hypothetical protein